MPIIAFLTCYYGLYLLVKHEVAVCSRPNPPRTHGAAWWKCAHFSVWLAELPLRPFQRVFGAAKRQRQREVELRKRIGELEAAQGIPLTTDGTCAHCGKPLLAEARFCSYCHAPTARTPRICPACGTRNAEDAAWCGACGAALTPTTPAPHPQLTH